MIYFFQIRASTEKLANGVQMGINYRLYAVERVTLFTFLHPLQLFDIRRLLN